MTTIDEKAFVYHLGARCFTDLDPHKLALDPTPAVVKTWKAFLSRDDDFLTTQERGVESMAARGLQIAAMRMNIYGGS